jgi:hypothetical protein
MGGRTTTVSYIHALGAVTSLRREADEIPRIVSRSFHEDTVGPGSCTLPTTTLRPQHGLGMYQVAISEGVGPRGTA